MTMTRNQFLRTLAGAGAGVLGASVLLACGSDDNASVDAPPQASGNCNQNGTTVVIATNHGHTLAVAKADITAATAKTYDIAGSSLHTHSVTITPAQFGMLAASRTITLMSTSDGTHSHNVTVSCA